MHILLVNYEYPPIGGGAGNATAHTALELSRDHDVTVLTARYANLPHLEVHGRLRILRVPARRRRADRSNVVEMLSFMAGAIGSLGRVRRQFGLPDVCIAYFGIPGGPVARWLQMTRGVPYLVSLRGGDVPGFEWPKLRRKHALTQGWIRRIWRRAAAVVANSNGLRDLAVKAADGHPVHVIPNGVDAERFHPNPPPPVDAASAHLRLVFSGRLVHQKGLDLLLPALAGLPADAPDWRLTLIGDGPERPALEHLAARLGLTPRVHFHGWTDRSAMPGVLRDADLYVFPSRDEGMPNTVLEAMASGLPVLTTRIPGCDELVLPGETGWLAAPEDVAALTAALQEALADRDRLRRFGQAGRQRVLDHYSWRAVADAYVALILATCPTLDKHAT